MDVFHAWVDQGKSPSNESYEYIVVPATTVETLEQNTSKNNIEIMANTPELQAVKHAGLHMIQAVFYKAGKIQLSEKLTLRCHSPGIILIALENDSIKQMTVADPNRELSRMHLSLSANIEKQAPNFLSVWNERKGWSECCIELPQGVYAGSSITINL